MTRSTRQRLLELVAPPPQPTAVDWEAAERALGITFPPGYRWLAETYGPGVFDDFLRFFVPGPTVLDLVAATAFNTEINRDWLSDPYAPPFPYPLHPEPGGLVVWAETVDRESLFWATDGPPEDWPTIVETFEDLGTWRYDGPAEELLLAMLERTVQIPYILPEAFEEPHTFSSASEPPVDSVGQRPA